MHGRLNAVENSSINREPVFRLGSALTVSWPGYRMKKNDDPAGRDLFPHNLSDSSTPVTSGDFMRYTSSIEVCFYCRRSNASVFKQYFMLFGFYERLGLPIADKFNRLPGFCKICKCKSELKRTLEYSFFLDVEIRSSHLDPTYQTLEASEQTLGLGSLDPPLLHSKSTVPLIVLRYKTYVLIADLKVSACK
eukprot:IDg9086t1